jgi:hypothetical protein
LERGAQSFSKIPGVQGFQYKIAWGLTILGFIAFFNMFFENLPGRGTVAVKLIEVSRLRFKTASTWGGN